MARLDDVRMGIEEVLRDFKDIASFSVTFEDDWDGAGIVYVELMHKRTNAPVGVEQMWPVADAVRERIFRSVEDRYPVIRHRFDPAQAIAEAA